MIALRLITLLVVCAALPAQVATSTRIGQGCRTLSSPLSYSVGRPVIGKPLTLRWMVTEPSTYSVAILFGPAARSTWNGCELHLIPAVVLHVPLTVPRTAQMSIPIPNDRALIGVAISTQLLWSTARQADLSAAYALVMGDR